MPEEPKVALTLEDCVREALKDRELVANYDRLRGTNLSCKGTAFELKIDEATGRMEGDVREFVAFIHEHVWIPLNTKEG